MAKMDDAEFWDRAALAVATGAIRSSMGDGQIARGACGIADALLAERNRRHAAPAPVVDTGWVLSAGAEHLARRKGNHAADVTLVVERGCGTHWAAHVGATGSPDCFLLIESSDITNVLRAADEWFAAQGAK